MPWWRLFYHFVWGTKERAPLIQPAWEVPLHKVICAKATEMGAVVHAIGGTEDHVHLVVCVPPSIALSAFVGQVKGSSSHFANHELALPGSFAWQAEYGVVSFGAKQLATVARYARNQRQHHGAGTTIAFLETTGSQATSHGKDSP